MTTLTDRTLNRTLWVRQRLVPALRTTNAVEDVVGHLVGLQAQESLAPYLGLAARVDGFDPTSASALLEERRLVRLLTMRGTVHLLGADDALALRPWVQPMLDRVCRPKVDVPTDALLEAAREALADGPLPYAELAARVGASFPAVPPEDLKHALPYRLPLVQVPPRGLWKRGGGVVYELADTWLGKPFTSVDVPALVERYLRAFGPASPADMTTWSRVTRLGPVFTAMAKEDRLVTHRDERGRTLYDVPDGELADPGLELPPLLLGTYDNLFLSHDDRARIATDERRREWMGPNGMIGSVLLLDGMVEGFWRRTDTGIDITPSRRTTKAEREAIEAERARVEALLFG